MDEIIVSTWEHILNYIECPEIYLDNSIAERSIECAKIHNINPEDYLRCIFGQAANTDSWTEDDWKNLLPWNIKITSFHKAFGFRLKGSKIDRHEKKIINVSLYNVYSVYQSTEYKDR